MKRVKKLKVHFTKHQWIYTHAAIFLFSFLFFVVGLDRIKLPVADETHYVNAGIEIMRNGINTNWSQPPLGKILIGLGTEIFGNNPYGWRVMSAFFGALTLNAMFILGFIFFKSELLALEVAILCFLNQFLFVHSRVGNLEVFMVAFVSWAFVFFFYHQETRRPRYLVASAFVFGLAMAVKWFSIVPLVVCAILFLTDQKNKRRGFYFWSGLATFVVSYFLMYSLCIGMTHPSWGGPLQVSALETDPRPSGVPEYSNDGLAKERAKPLPKYEFADFLQLQIEMFKALKKYKTPYPYTSEWYTWPIMNVYYPLIWRLGDGVYSGILLIGHPLILWFGFLASGVCLFAWIRRKNPVAKNIAVLYFSLWLSWIIIPRNSYFLFYYFPAAMILSLNIVFAFQYLKISRRRQMVFVSACILVFAFFYPLLSSVILPSNLLPYRVVLAILGVIP